MNAMDYVIALSRDEAALAAAQSALAEHARGLEATVRLPGILIRSAADMPLTRLPGNRGMILGRVFSRGSNRLHSALGDAEQRRVVESEGHSLLSQYWGHYLCITTDEDGHASVLRDPAGGIQCYYVRAGEVVFLSSDVRLLLTLAGTPPSIDVTMLRLFLEAPDLRPERTLLSGVRELLRGHALRSSRADVAITRLWSPWTFTGGVAPEDATRALRGTIVQSVHALAADSRHILLDLSGGLDSSIVAASLATMGQRFTCLSFTTGQPSGDETLYARAVCERLGTPLVEVALDLGQVDLDVSHASHLPRPSARSFIQAWDKASEATADRVEADRFFTGGGGDSLFCYLRSAAPAADRALAAGPGLGFIQTALDISRMTGAPLTQVLGRGLKRAYLQPRKYRWARENSFLRPVRERSALLDGTEHPSLDVPLGGKPGNAGHIASLMQIENYLEGFRRGGADQLCHPLLSQPIQELCLSIPSWRWCEGGIDRRIARDAFADLLPPLVIGRRQKGAPESFVVRLFEAQRTTLRSMLLDGELAKYGVIDRHAIDQQLSENRPAGGVEASRLLRLGDVEAWLRAWN